MRGIKVTYVGIVDYSAICSNCTWREDDYLDRAAVRRQARKHVRETGHMVIIEKTAWSSYEKLREESSESS